MFDIFSPITDFIGTIAQWVGYGILFTAVVGALFLLVAIPVMVKMAAVAVARTSIVEVAKLLSETGIAASFTNATNSVTNAANALTIEMRKQQTRSNYEVIRVDDVEVR